VTSCLIKDDLYVSRNYWILRIPYRRTPQRRMLVRTSRDMEVVVVVVVVEGSTILIPAPGI
jgi:hypothetical protein